MISSFVFNIVHAMWSGLRLPVVSRILFFTAIRYLNLCNEARFFSSLLEDFGRACKIVNVNWSISFVVNPSLSKAVQYNFLRKSHNAFFVLCLHVIVA